MAIFVRKSRRGDWDRVAADTPADLAFPANVLADILDNENEVSVWEVSDPPAAAELDTIVAALHARNVSNLTDVTLRVISDWKVKRTWPHHEEHSRRVFGYEAERSEQAPGDSDQFGRRRNRFGKSF